MVSGVGGRLALVMSNSGQTEDTTDPSANISQLRRCQRKRPPLSFRRRASARLGLDLG